MDLKEVARRAIEISASSGNTETEIIISLEHRTESTFTKNRVKLNKVLDYSPVGIRVLRGKSTGFSSINTLSEESIARCVERATSLARATPEDRFNVIPEGGELKELDGLYDPEVVHMEPSEIAEMAASLISAVAEIDSRITIEGSVSASYGTTVIMNSNGITASQKETLLSWDLFGMAVDGDRVSSFDGLSGSSHFRSKADPYPGITEFSESVIGALNATGGESFKGSLIMRPDAFAEMMLMPLVSSACADSVQKGRSRLEGKLGEEIAFEGLSVADDGLFMDGTSTSAFDREGIPQRRTEIISDGVLRNFLHSSYTAGKWNTSSTGNASGSAYTGPGNGPTNVVVASGTDSLESLIRDTGKGILMNRFSGNISGFTGDFSGVVKCGYLIENGELRRPVKS